MAINPLLNGSVTFSNIAATPASFNLPPGHVSPADRHGDGGLCRHHRNRNGPLTWRRCLTLSTKGI
jgi:hypothetical protein